MEEVQCLMTSATEKGGDRGKMRHARVPRRDRGTFPIHSSFKSLMRQSIQILHDHARPRDSSRESDVVL